MASLAACSEASERPNAMGRLKIGDKLPVETEEPRTFDGATDRAERFRPSMSLFRPPPILAFRFTIENAPENSTICQLRLLPPAISGPSDKVLISFCNGVYQTGVLPREPGTIKFVVAQSLPEHWSAWHVLSKRNRRINLLP